MISAHCYQPAVYAAAGHFSHFSTQFFIMVPFKALNCAVSTNLFTACQDEYLGNKQDEDEENKSGCKRIKIFVISLIVETFNRRGAVLGQMTQRSFVSDRK